MKRIKKRTIEKVRTVANVIGIGKAHTDTNLKCHNAKSFFILNSATRNIDQKELAMFINICMTYFMKSCGKGNSGIWEGEGAQ